MNCNETIKLTFGPCHTRYKCPCSRKLILKRVSAMVCVIIPFDKNKFYLLIHKVREEEYFFQALVLIFKCLRFHYLHIKYPYTDQVQLANRHACHLLVSPPLFNHFSLSKSHVLFPPPHVFNVPVLSTIKSPIVRYKVE